MCVFVRGSIWDVWIKTCLMCELIYLYFFCITLMLRAHKVTALLSIAWNVVFLCLIFAMAALFYYLNFMMERSMVLPTHLDNITAKNGSVLTKCWLFF